MTTPSSLEEIRLNDVKTMDWL